MMILLAVSYHNLNSNMPVTKGRTIIFIATKESLIFLSLLFLRIVILI